MNFQLNTNLGNWLTKLNGKAVDKIYQIASNIDRQDGGDLPCLILISFSDFDRFLEIEGDFDGAHMKINFNEISELNRRIKNNDSTDEGSLLRVYECNSKETITKLQGQKIDYVQYGIDKDEFKINGNIAKGRKDEFTFIRFKCDKLSVTIFVGSAPGLGVSDNPDVELNFEETFDTYDTRTQNG